MNKKNALITLGWMVATCFGEAIVQNTWPAFHLWPISLGIALAEAFPWLRKDK